MNGEDLKMTRLIEFRAGMQTMREMFPEHALEIDRAIWNVAKKITTCADEKCACRDLTFEKFHEMQNKFAGKHPERKSYEFN